MWPESVARHLKGVTMQNPIINQELQRTQVELSEHEQCIIDHALSIIESKLKTIEDLVATNTSLVGDYLKIQTSLLEREVFGILYLDNRHRLLANEILFTGTVNAASVYPREVIKSALFKNASAVILYHNHPSGDAEPSQADKSITKKISDALEVLDIRTLDHFIIGHDEYFSFSNRGLI